MSSEVTNGATIPTESSEIRIPIPQLVLNSYRLLGHTGVGPLGPVPSMDSVLQKLIRDLPHQRFGPLSIKQKCCRKCYSKITEYYRIRCHHHHQRGFACKVKVHEGHHDFSMTPGRPYGGHSICRSDDPSKPVRHGAKECGLHMESFRYWVNHLSRHHLFECLCHPASNNRGLSAFVRNIPVTNQKDQDCDFC